MGISGLVVTLDSEPASAEFALEMIAEAGPFQLGERIGPRLAVALEAGDEHAALEWHDWVSHLPGVVHVALVFVALSRPSTAVKPAAKEAVHVR